MERFIEHMCGGSKRKAQGMLSQLMTQFPAIKEKIVEKARQAQLKDTQTKLGRFFTSPAFARECAMRVPPPPPVSVQIAFISHWQLSHSRNPVSRKMQETMTWYTTNSVMVYNEMSNTAELIPTLQNIGGIKLFGFASSYRMKVRSRQWKHEKG